MPQAEKDKQKGGRRKSRASGRPKTRVPRIQHPRDPEARLGDAHPKGTPPSGPAFHWDHHQQLCGHHRIGCGRARHWIGDQSRTDPRERIPGTCFRMDQPSGHRHRTAVLDVHLHRFDCSVPVQGAGQFGIEPDPDALFFRHRPPHFRT